MKVDRFRRQTIGFARLFLCEKTLRCSRVAIEHGPFTININQP